MAWTARDISRCKSERSEGAFLFQIPHKYSEFCILEVEAIDGAIKQKGRLACVSRPFFRMLRENIKN
jgi:hypothetical protein